MRWTLEISWHDSGGPLRDRRLLAMRERVGNPTVLQVKPMSPDPTGYGHVRMCWAYDDSHAAHEAMLDFVSRRTVNEEGQAFLLGDRFPQDAPNYDVSVSLRSIKDNVCPQN